MRYTWLGLFVVVACGSGGTAPPPPAAARGGSSGSSGRSTPVSSGAASNAGAPGETAGDASSAAGAGQGLGGAADGGAGGAADAGAGVIFQMAGAPPLEPPGVCAPDLKLGADQAQAAGAAAPHLLAMTPDELSLAFTTGEADSLALNIADRASTSAAFSAAALSMPKGYEAGSGVSLSSDGLTLILVLADHSGFGELSRSSRKRAFKGTPDTTAYAKINALKPMSGHSVGWPVLSSDGQDLYFLSYFGQGLAVQSKRGKDGVFDFGSEIDEFTLGGNEGEYKLLSGISSDQRAIFFFDQATQHAMALFRSRPGAPFYDPLDLGERQGATPNQDCSRVYSSVPSGLVVQSAE